MLNDQIDRDMIISTTGNDHIGVFLRWQTKLLERWLDMVGIAGEDMFQISTVFFHVTEDTTRQTRVCIGVDKEFHLEKILSNESTMEPSREPTITHPNFGKIKDENSLEDDHWDGFNRIEHSVDMLVFA